MGWRSFLLGAAETKAIRKPAIASRSPPPAGPGAGHAEPHPHFRKWPLQTDRDGCTPKKKPADGKTGAGEPTKQQRGRTKWRSLSRW